MKSLLYSCKLIVPVLFSYVFVGLAYGILLHQAGYSALLAFLSSIFIYAGAMQIVMLSLMVCGTPLITIAIMTFFVNARHVFYGIGFIDEFKKIGGIKYPFMALTMTDETYSILCSASYPEEVDKEKSMFYVQLLCYLLWICTSTLGALIGELLTCNMDGIGFTATAFFVTVVVNQWREVDSHLPAIVGLLSALIFFFAFGADNFILPALSMSVIVLVILKDKIALKKEDTLNV
ncbi:MAG: AzlC family ABC transporter permease [Oscillospiraceae bacterium]|nr:AzlC family ABC transporter permease [Oscillospiraceae bacterium]